MNLIKDYTNTIPKKTSQKTYTVNLNTFFKTINKTPNNFLKQSEGKIKRDIRTFLTKSLQINHQNKTIQTNLSIIRSFIEEYQEEYNISISNQYWKKLRKKYKGRPTTQKDYIQKEDLKKILQHGNTLDRAIFLFKATSGLRTATIVKLEFNDIKFDTVPPKIEVPAKISKNNLPHTTFITQEAKEILLEWYKERTKYLHKARNYKQRKVNINKDQRIFPYDVDTINKKWTRLTKDAGYYKKDKTTERNTARQHLLKSFFKTQLLRADLNAKYIDYLCEHRSLLDETYIQHIEETLPEQYLKVEEYLTIFGSTINKDEITQEIEYLRKQNTELRQNVKSIETILNTLLNEKYKEAENHPKLSKEAKEVIKKIMNIQI